MGSTETETDALETLEMGHDALPGTGETWNTSGTSRTRSRWDKSLAHVPDTRDKRSPEVMPIGRHRAGKHCETILQTTLFLLNRRMRHPHVRWCEEGG